MLQVSACTVCGSAELARWRARADGLWVLRCAHCGMGVVEQLPESLASFYGDDYYHSPSASIGYADYQAESAGAVAWASALIRLLAPGGRILDVGCADGSLLRDLLHSHECCGIEVNPNMTRLAADAGVRIVARDLFDPQLRATCAGSFDVVSAVAVFEHLADFRRGVEVVLDLLKPDGWLLFEVPLLAPEDQNSVWLASSLEHVYYPFEDALHHLFDEILGVRLLSHELRAVDYGSTLIGLASRDPGCAARLERQWSRLVHAPAAELATPMERTFRFLLEALHAGIVTPEHIGLMEECDFCQLPASFRRRMLQLWRRDVAKLQALVPYLKSVEEARDWHKERADAMAASLAAALAARPAGQSGSR